MSLEIGNTPRTWGRRRPEAVRPRTSLKHPHGPMAIISPGNTPTDVGKTGRFRREFSPRWKHPTDVEGKSVDTVLTETPPTDVGKTRTTVDTSEINQETPPRTWEDSSSYRSSLRHGETPHGRLSSRAVPPPTETPHGRGEDTATCICFSPLLQKHPHGREDRRLINPIRRVVYGRGEDTGHDRDHLDPRTWGRPAEPPGTG